MTNYNDGKWHGWNSGVMPVNGRSLVDVVFRCQGYKESRTAISWSWHCPEEPIIAFCVTKEYKEPREYWLWPNIHGNLVPLAAPFEGAIHVREVVE